MTSQTVPLPHLRVFLCVRVFVVRNFHFANFDFSFESLVARSLLSTTPCFSNYFYQHFHDDFTCLSRVNLSRSPLANLSPPVYSNTRKKDSPAKFHLVVHSKVCQISLFIFICSDYFYLFIWFNSYTKDKKTCTWVRALQTMIIHGKNRLWIMSEANATS